MKRFSCCTYIAVSMVLILGGCSHSSYLEHSGSMQADMVEEADTVAKTGDVDAVSKEGEPSEAGHIFVQVAGAVKSPGVYKLAEDARVFEALKMAGGLSENADENSLNQAEKLTDGQKLYVLREDEVPESPVGRSGVAGEVIAGDADAGFSTEGEGLININTADSGMLMTLSGIGEAKANAIISYRQANGGFHSVEELKQVDGIGDATFEKLKACITI